MKMLSSQSEILRSARERLGYSQQYIARELGFHIRQYQRFEYGERSLESCSMKTGLKICAILQIDPYDIVHLD